MACVEQMKKPKCVFMGATRNFWPEGTEQKLQDFDAKIFEKNGNKFVLVAQDSEGKKYESAIIEFPKNGFDTIRTFVNQFE